MSGPQPTRAVWLPESFDKLCGEAPLSKAYSMDLSEEFGVGVVNPKQLLPPSQKKKKFLYKSVFRIAL